MFRDYKTGSYNIEGTGLKGERLIKIILLMAIAYSSAMFQGTEIQKKQVQKYISRSKEPRKNTEYGVHLALVKMGDSG
jgi:hypothetical protein